MTHPWKGLAWWDIYGVSIRLTPRPLRSCELHGIRAGGTFVRHLALLGIHIGRPHPKLIELEFEYGQASGCDSEVKSILIRSTGVCMGLYIYVRDTKGQSMMDMSFEVQVSGEKRDGECGCVVGQWMKESKRLSSEQGEVRSNSEREMCRKGLRCDE